MKKSNTLILSTTVLVFLTTGCVKKPVPITPPVAATATPTQPTYDGAVIYEEAAPIVYDNGAGVSQSGTLYGSEVPVTDTTVITTDGTYGQSNTGTYGQSQGGAYGQSTGGTGTYSQPQGGTYSQPAGGGSGIYGQPVSGGGAYNAPYDTPSTGSYGGGGYTSTPSAPQGGGIQLQVAALRDYAGAEAYKNSLSLDPRYSAYVQRGAVNKVIVTGIGSVAEANQLKETRFPGAFIVSGNSSSGGGGYAPASSSSGAYGSYTVNEPYGGGGATPSSSGGGYSSYSGGLGVQIGAFSSRSKAQSVANSQGGRYPAKVKTATSNGRTIYKVILTGFSNESAARSYASSHNGFIVH